MTAIDPQADLRQQWRAWATASRTASVPFPAELQALTCGARTRAGTPCKRRDLYRSGRCKMHGGLSTGPRSSEGKAKVAANGRSKAHGALTKVDDEAAVSGEWPVDIVRGVEPLAS